LSLKEEVDEAQSRLGTSKEVQAQREERINLRKQIIDAMLEAISYYARKKALVLEVEGTLKLARFYVQESSDFNLESNTMLMRVYCDDADSFSIQDKIQLSNAIAQIYKHMGYERKFAYFIRECAQLCENILLHDKASSLLRAIAPYYHLPLPDIKLVAGLVSGAERDSRKSVKDAPSNSEIEISRREKLLKTGTKYLELHRAILERLIAISKEMDDPKRTILYLAYFLRKLGTDVEKEKQQVIAKDLLKITKPMPLQQLNMAGLLTIDALEPFIAHKERDQITRLISKKEKEAQDSVQQDYGPFLYRPDRPVPAANPAQTGRNRYSAYKNKEQLKSGEMNYPLVALDEQRVFTWQMELINPYHFPLNLVNVTLHANFSHVLQLTTAKLSPQDVQAQGTVFSGRKKDAAQTPPVTVTLDSTTAAGITVGQIKLEPNTHHVLLLSVKVPLVRAEHVDIDQVLAQQRQQLESQQLSVTKHVTQRLLTPRLLEYTALNLHFQHKLNKQLGPCTVELIDPFPYLAVHKSVPTHVDLSMYDGEYLEYELRMENSGGATIDYVELTLHQEFVDSTADLTLSANTSSLLVDEHVTKTTHTKTRTSLDAGRPTRHTRHPSLQLSSRDSGELAREARAAVSKPVSLTAALTRSASQRPHCIEVKRLEAQLSEHLPLKPHTAFTLLVPIIANRFW
jgi:hypothetical protein